MIPLDANAAKAISRKCRVTSTHNNKTYPTQKYTSCRTRNIVYLLECTKCTKKNQYIEHTSKPLYIKLAEHRKARHQINLPIHVHFTRRANHDLDKDAKVTILKATTRRQLLEEEQKWIQLMDLPPKN